MASIRRQRVIDAPAEQVWGVVGDPGALAQWFPAIEACEVRTEAGATVRDVRLASGVRLGEKIVTRDPITRRFQYEIQGGGFRSHRSTVDVIELAPRRCLVVYGTDAEPDVMALVIGGASGEALERLASLVTGEEDTDAAATAQRGD